MTENITQNNSKRIAKNTLLLYIRTFITMAISLYTSRVILEVLGINDFGIYNVVGGFVGMFALISATLTSSTQRFITYELGKKDENLDSCINTYNYSTRNNRTCRERRCIFFE